MDYDNESCICPKCDQIAEHGHVCDTAVKAFELDGRWYADVSVGGEVIKTVEVGDYPDQTEQDAIGIAYDWMRAQGM